MLHWVCLAVSTDAADGFPGLSGCGVDGAGEVGYMEILAVRGSGPLHCVCVVSRCGF